MSVREREGQKGLPELKDQSRGGEGGGFGLAAEKERRCRKRAAHSLLVDACGESN